MKRQIILRDEQGRARDLDREARHARQLDRARRAHGEVIRPNPDLEGIAIFDALDRTKVFLHVCDIDDYEYPFGARAMYIIDPFQKDFRASFNVCPVSMAMTLRGGNFGMCAKVFVVSDNIDPELFVSHWDRNARILDSGIVPTDKLTFLKAEHRFTGLSNYVYVGPGIT